MSPNELHVTKPSETGKVNKVSKVVQIVTRGV